MLLAIVAILVVTVAGTILASDRWLRPRLEEALAVEMQRQARVAAIALPRQAGALAGAARRLGVLTARRVTIVDSTGLVVGDSDFDDAALALLDNHLDRPEIRDALARGVGISKRQSESTNRPELKVALRAWPGVLRISAPMEQVDAIVANAERAVFLGAVAALAVGITLAGIGGREVGRPLTQLAAAARSLAAGRPPVYPAARIPEVRHLVRAFRAMQEELAERVEALQQGREETAAILESMVEGVAAADSSGQVVFCNAALRRLFQYAPDAPLPNLRDLFRSVDAREVLDHVLAGRAVLGREVAFEGRTVLVTARPLPPGGAVVCLHDITDLRRLEAIRRDFVANVSHELKTPLTNIAGYTHTLLTDRPEEATAVRFLEVIASNAERMHRLVDDLLDLAKLESGSWTPAAQELDPRAAGDGAWAPFAERARAAGVRFSIAVASGARVLADPEALRQILGNLFDNALRYTPPGGAIELEVRPADRGTSLAVRDTGSGIPAEHLPRVFERFYRVDPARSRDHGGTGLGLSIVKHLVEAHGGRVDLTSAVGQGTTVRVTLPHPGEWGAGSGGWGVGSGVTRP
jgi:two-component system, OmpR family, phosphate regulon sensor histidine kinase PhoR